MYGQYFGTVDAVPITGDYDGDGRTDMTFFWSGEFYRLNSSNGAFVRFGIDGHPENYIPQPGNFNGDQRDEAAGFDPVTGDWFWDLGNLQTARVHFGQNGDKPCREDYNGDHETDLCVYRAGVWYRANSDLTETYGEQFGLPDDLPVPADYDGDGRADFAVFRPSSGDWYFHFSSDGSVRGIHWGQSGDIPVPGDYDGDGKYDIAVFRDGVWYIYPSSGAPFYGEQFGLSSDIPVPSKYIQ